jgi:predicted nucleic acid-binding protein
LADETRNRPLYLPRLVAIEFESGMPDDVASGRYLSLFTILPMDEPVLKETVRIMRALRTTGQGIGGADSIIAATAKLYGLPLVNRTSVTSNASTTSTCEALSREPTASVTA